MVLGEGQPASSPAAVGSGESCKLPYSGVWGGALAAKRISCIPEASDSVSWNLSGPRSEGGMAREQSGWTAL